MKTKQQQEQQQQQQQQQNIPLSPQKKQQQKTKQNNTLQFILNVFYVLLFCLFRTALSVCLFLYGPVCHGAFNLDPIYSACNTFSLNIMVIPEMLVTTQYKTDNSLFLIK